MRVVGLAVTMEGDHKATVHGVVLDDASGVLTLIDRFDITHAEADITTRLYDMAESARTRIDSLAPEAVAIRRADFPPTGSRKEAPKVRLLAEGALASAARSRCVCTFLATAKELAGWRSLDKDGLEEEAKEFLKTNGAQQKYKGATTAALAALTHP